MKGRAVIVVAAALLALALIVALVVRPGAYLNAHTLGELELRCKSVLQHHGPEARFAFVAAFTLLGVVGLPVVTVLIPVGGFLFGWGEGALWGMVGSLLTALASYAMARRWLGQWLRRRYTARQRWLRMEINRHGASYLLILRLLLVVPFVWINTIAGLTRTSLGHFLWTLVAGTLPVCMLYAYAGFQLRRMDSMHDILTPQLIGVFIGFAMLVAGRLVWLKLSSRRSHRTAVTL